MHRAREVGVVLAGLSAVSWGCGELLRGSERGGEGGAPQGGSGGHSDVPEIGGFGPSGPGSGPGSGSGGGACAGTTVKAEVVPLDMYVLLDRSGSMLDPTGASGDGPTKWAAVTAAIEAFLWDPGSEGLGVGIQFFPVEIPGVPETCESSEECGPGGPCLLHACETDLVQGTITPCDLDSDCGVFDACIPLGQCQNDSDYVCIYHEPEVSCGSDPEGNDLGTCAQMLVSFCVNEDSCSPVDYGSPAVEISPLAGSAQALVDVIDSTSPGGATPTAPALGGAIEHAREWAKAHPSRRVVAVLATDGMPTECEPQDIPSIAAIAAAGQVGSPPVSTFVIGVFGANDAGAQQNLDAIALAGGTGSAHFIADDQDVAQGFLAALHAIQGETLACEYQIPSPPDGSELDYGKINVEYTAPGAVGPRKVYHVGAPGECDPVLGGWYYDADPAAGGAPTKILTCPATCAELSAAGGQIDIEIGCETIVF